MNNKATWTHFICIPNGWCWESKSTVEIIHKQRGWKFITRAEGEDKPGEGMVKTLISIEHEGYRIKKK